MNMDFERKLPIPMEVKEKYPITAKVEETVEAKRVELKKIFSGEDKRLVLVIGPAPQTGRMRCSITSPGSERSRTRWRTRS